MSESEREEMIRKRAYEIYQARGGSDGLDQDDWLKAEQELFGGVERVPSDEEMPNRAHAATPPGSPDLLGEPGRGTRSKMFPPASAASSNEDAKKAKEEKILEASEESFPASDAPAWRGGTSA
jgi:hypothetical protein